MKFELALDNRGAADQALLDDLRRVATLLGSRFVTRDQYEDHGRFHPKTLVKRFGSWNKSLELAGLPIHKPMNLEAEPCIADLQRVASLLGKSSVTIEEYKQLGVFSDGPFRRVFGNWASALGAAGLQPSENYRERNSDQQLHQNLEAVWRAVGRQPKQSDMRQPLSRIGHDAYCRRFGSWRKALEAFVSYINEDPPASVSEKSSPTLQPQPALADGAALPRTSRNISWRLRFLVMRRDGFRCQQCGQSPAITPGTVLVIDHVVAWSKGGESVFENLRTLCEVCNGGKSDLSAEEIGVQPTVKRQIFRR